MSVSEVGVSMGHEQQDLFDKQPPPWELDDQREVCVAVVAFPEIPFGPYDYEVPAALRAEVQPGVRVQVPLGRGNRQRLGYCIAVENRSGGARRSSRSIRSRTGSPCYHPRCCV